MQSIAVAPQGDLILGLCGGTHGAADVLTGGGDTLCAWNIQTGREVWHTEFACRGVMFSPDGKTFTARASGKKELCIFDTASGKVQSRIDLDCQWISCMAFSRDGRRIYTHDSTTLCGFDVASGKRLFPADTVSGRLVCGNFEHLAASADGRKLYSGTLTSPVVVWDVPGGKVQTVWDAGVGVKSLDLRPGWTPPGCR